MMSSDYSDNIDLGIPPEEDSQYNVAPFIQNAFNKYVKVYRIDIANEIKAKTFMKLL